MTSVLIIDDEPNIRRMIGALIGAEGYEVRDANDGAAAVAAAEESGPDIALLDLMMPGPLDGLATLARLREIDPDLPVIMMSGRAGLADAVRATKLGAFNFLEKPLTPEGLLLALGSALELRRARLTARDAARTLRDELGHTGELVGASPEMQQVRELIARVAATDASVLVVGESGTGKELVAAAIHRESPRRDRPFIRVNCAAIPRDLVESEMFGHERGAFTGATERRIGRFEMAHTGTLFLDEVGDLGPEAQAKLLRAIEAREIERVGGRTTKPIRVDVRILAATNKDLPRAVAAGNFREDLYFRLNVIPLSVPPLRVRPGDIPALVQHFQLVTRARTGRPLAAWRADALALLERYAWPGNVRELGNIVERLAILRPVGEEREVTAAHVLSVLPGIAAPMTNGAVRSATPAESRGVVPDRTLPPPALDAPLADTLDDYERTLISRALSAAGGNVTEAARRLQTDRPNLYRRMKRLGIMLACVAAAMIGGQTLGAQQSPRDTIPKRSRSDSTQVDSTHRDSTPPSDTTSPEIERFWRRWLVPHRSGNWFGFAVTSAHTYNRLEGLPVYLGPGIRHELPWGSVRANVYGIVRTAEIPHWNEQDLGYIMSSELRVGHEHAVAFGVRAYDEIDPVEDWGLSDGEVGLSSFFFHKDYRDYFDRHGATGYMSLAATSDASLTLSYGDERWSSRDALNPLTLILNGTRWRPNPQLDDGLFRVVGAHLLVDSRNDETDPWAGWYVKADVNDDAGRITHFGPVSTVPAADSGPATINSWRGFFDIRRYNRVNQLMSINLRAVVGGWLGGDQLPLEERLSLGGAGTLPGFGFRSPGLGAGTDVAGCGSNGTVPLLNVPRGEPAQCDRIALVQGEFRHDLHIGLGPWAKNAQFDGQWVVFADAGRGWLVGPRDGELQYPAGSFPAPGTFMSDAGVGVNFSPIGLYLAEPISRGTGFPRVVVRVVQRF
jgi:two-component system nitrogen regulation response regulator NtrX